MHLCALSGCIAFSIVYEFLIFVVTTKNIHSDIEPPLLFLLLLHAAAQAQTERNSSTWERFYLNVFLELKQLQKRPYWISIANCQKAICLQL